MTHYFEIMEIVFLLILHIFYKLPNFQSRDKVACSVAYNFKHQMGHLSYFRQFELRERVAMKISGLKVAKQVA